MSRVFHTGSYSQASTFSLNLSVGYLFPSLEKLKTKTVPIVDGSSCYEGRCSILIETGHFYSYRKDNYSHFTDTENPKCTIRYSEHFQT